VGQIGSDVKQLGPCIGQFPRSRQLQMQLQVRLLLNLLCTDTQPQQPAQIPVQFRRMALVKLVKILLHCVQVRLLGVMECVTRSDW
jgi:hypothetical protein